MNRFLALLAFAAAAGASPLPARAAADAVPGEVIVKFREGAGRARREAAVSALPAAARVRAFDFISAEHLRFEGISTPEAIARLRASADVQYAEPNYYIYADATPNDSLFAQLWGLHNTGQGGGYAGDDIHAPQAWDLFTGDPGLLIGVIDTGIDYRHPDLAANVWTNPGEIPGNGIDDDHNGYVDDVHGYNFLANNGDPMDDGTHGTHVAGTIGAAGNNTTGVVGVNWRCRMVAIKFMDAAGVGTEAAAIASIQYAIAVGARVTNNSWGNMPGGQALRDAIDAAGAAGQLFVNAAGNNGWNIDLVPFYPASFLSPYMIKVAATDGRDLRPSWSNYGPTTVDLGAPGYAILSCKPGGAYQSLNGTSMSCPHVTGVVALAMGRFPHATNLQIRQLVLGNTDPVASMNGITTTGGRLDAYKVLRNGDAVAPARVSNLAIADTGSTSLGLGWTAPGDDTTSGTATRYDLRISPSTIDSANFALATPVVLPGPHVAGTVENAQIQGLSFHTHYHFALRAIDDFGNPGPVSNDVSATTLGIPAIGLSPAALTLALAPGAAGDTSVVVSNLAAGRLDFTLPSPAPAPWLSGSPTSGRVLAPNSMRLGLHLDATALAAGAYDALLPIASNDPVTPTANVSVHLVVSGPVAVGGLPRVSPGLRIRSPNPSPHRVALELALASDGPVDVALFDLHGRQVARLARGAFPAGVHPLDWNRADASGARAAPGVYFARAWTREGTWSVRVVILD